MPATEPLPIYAELLDLLADIAAVDHLLAFRLSKQRQVQLNELLQRNRDGQFTRSDRSETDEFARLEHLGRMLKAGARQKQQRSVPVPTPEDHRAG